MEGVLPGCWVWCCGGSLVGEVVCVYPRLVLGVVAVHGAGLVMMVSGVETGIEVPCNNDLLFLLGGCS